MTRKKSGKKKTVNKKRKKAKKPAPVITPEKQDITPTPTAGAVVSDFEKTLQEQIAAAETAEQQQPPPRRGPGRPRKDQQPEPGIDITEQLVAQAVKVPFHLWAIKQDVGELKLQDNEAAALANPIKQLLDYYAPSLPPIVVAWFALAVTSYSVMAARLQIIAALKKQKNPPPNQQSGGPAAAGPSPGGPDQGAGPGPGPGPGAGGQNKGPTGFPTLHKK